mmetsp:Transcript_7962/g.15542  ORF Transcript_7962/g.15542 Transcript_7962/m.15542 type:complete len:674 (-) Transcript_7962:1061-3082(-)
MANLLTSVDRAFVANLAEIHGAELFSSFVSFRRLLEGELEAQDLLLIEALMYANISKIKDTVLTIYRKLFDPNPNLLEAQGRCISLFAAVIPETFSDFCLELCEVLERGDALKSLLVLTALKGILCVVPVKVYSSYSAVLLIPLLKRFNSPLGSLIRELFGDLLRVAPLTSTGSTLDTRLEERRNEGLQFLGFLSGKFALPEFSLSVPINIELRHYQKEGVRWLKFLKNYRLNGMLCDDMGLGKTLQALCVIAEAHLETEFEHSLVVCPASLVKNWVAEVNRYFSPDDLTAEVYRKLFPFQAKIIVTSYESLKKNIDLFQETFCYVVLDEGHLIRSSKTKAYRAIKSLSYEHSLILSGTPIHNQILDIWSYFDFLMPGFLGTEEQFVKKYKKDLAPKQGAVTFKDEVLAMTKLDSLHKQVLPFILRRKKDDVLTELPSKIIQDYLVELDPNQQTLLSSFKQRGNIETFEELSFLRKLCNHPRLATSDSSYALMDSPKLRSIKDLIKVCEISEEDGANHKALIFSQMIAMLDLIAEMIETEFKNTKYSRLDGKVPAMMRQEVVDEFNSNDKIRLMLLTTKVGGLGLNLTAADIVIFVDHDWNPINDLQAMDRAHRLGQKRAVNVYRLITQDSLEERILGIQAFKTKIGETLVSADNSSMSALDTAELLENLSKS